LFIDDDPGNVERAKQKGWQAILYVDFESFHSEMNKLLRF
jgi:putative hydrolase of the HAD superfamily